MRRLALLTFVTLDGVMQGPSSPDEDRSDGFESGGWALPYWESTMEQVARVAMKQPYDMLFGRKTYELFAAHWPDASEDPVSNRLNAAQKYVVSNTDPVLPWGPADLISGDVAARISDLKAGEGPLLQVHGSCTLCQFLLAQGLVDELRLWTFPVTLGSGRKLFGEPTMPASWNVIASDRTGQGVQMSVYARA